MPSRACGYCGVHAHFTPVGPTHVAYEDEGFMEYVQSSFECAACGLVSLGTTDLVSGMPGFRADLKVRSEKRYWDLIGVDTWLPGNTGPTIQNLPPAVAVASADAYKSYKSGIIPGAVLLARTTIEATAKDHGITQGTLAAKFQKMLDDGLILESTKRAADAIRHLGNDMAHGDLEVALGRDVARDVVELMQLVLREVYELPYLAENLQNRADERSQAAAQRPNVSAIAAPNSGTP
jgi:hypothetical protein